MKCNSQLANNGVKLSVKAKLFVCVCVGVVVYGKLVKFIIVMLLP